MMVLTCISLVTNDVEYLIMCLSFLFIWQNIQIFCTFLKVAHLFYYYILELFIIFWIQALFFQFVTFFFLNNFFWEALNCSKIQLIFSRFYIYDPLLIFLIRVLIQVWFLTYGYPIFQFLLLHYLLFTEFFLCRWQKLIAHLCKCGLLWDSILP